MWRNILKTTCLAVLLVSTVASQRAGADWKPEKPVTLIVPFGAGGGTDVTARALVEVINKNGLSPQPWVVVNKPGAGGLNGVRYIKERAGDPYTLVAMVTSSMTSGLMQADLDLGWRQLTPIANLGVDIQYLCTNTSTPFKTVEEFLKYAKDNPGKVKFGIGGGLGSEDHLTTLMLVQKGYDVRPVTFEGGGELKKNIAGGHVDAAWLNPSEMKGFLVEDGGTVYPIAVAWPERTADFPKVPTLREKGTDVVFDAFFRGVMGPANLSPEASKFYSEVIGKAVQDAAWKKMLTDLGIYGAYKPAPEFKQALEKWDHDLSELLKMVKNN
jgi:putative tricarboxylic transport membrane protein